MEKNTRTDGNYEIIRNRLRKQATELSQRLGVLNTARREAFGNTESKLIANDRITTHNYCVARDLTTIGNVALLGYNVHIGLRSGIKLKDVFSVFTFQDGSFKEQSLDLLKDSQFATDFKNLYRYYKNASFARFETRGRHLYMVFHLQEGSTDFKAFKWLLTDKGGLQYVDNRSDHELAPIAQYEFKWKRSTRDDQRKGRHPHVSILERVFVETVGGDLTIKIEDNTEDGRGIYAEAVDYADQTLDDAEFAYAELGNLIALRIRPYQEADRYFVYNEGMQSVQRVDALSTSGVLLPDNQGLIFSNGYYLQTGEFKLFDNQMEGLAFWDRLSAPNGEDYIYVFNEPKSGHCVLLRYNIISQQVETPIICNGYTLLPGGQLCYFRAEEEATKHHTLQVWQTPFTEGLETTADANNFLVKIGNREIVRAMAAATEILNLTAKDDSYGNLYDELVSRINRTLDNYHWLDQKEAGALAPALVQIRDTSNLAIEEFEKVNRERRQTKEAVAATQKEANTIFDEVRRATFSSIDDFVQLLARLRAMRGQIASLRELRYLDLEAVNTLEQKVLETNEKLGTNCVDFLLRDDALEPYKIRLDELQTATREVATVMASKELDEQLTQTGLDLEMLIEIVSNLKIEDATQTTAIIDRISELFTVLNQLKAAVSRRRSELETGEAEAEFRAQLKLLDQSVVNYLNLSETIEKTDQYLSKLMVQLEELETRFATVDAFTLTLAEKREEAYAAFEARKNSLTEARNNRTTALAAAANRILGGVEKRSQSFKSQEEINTYFSADLMVDKVRQLIKQLTELEDTNKAGQLQTKLKSLKEEAVRQLRDRKELYVDGEGIIKLGRHRFNVNNQPLELTVVNQEDKLAFHLTGTDYYYPVTDERIHQLRAVWNQALPSETRTIYRSEFLTYTLWKEGNLGVLSAEERATHVKQEAARRFDEGYVKGIHDEDAIHILEAFLQLDQQLGSLRHGTAANNLATIWWQYELSTAERKNWQQRLSGAQAVRSLYGTSPGDDLLVNELATHMQNWLRESGLDTAKAELFPHSNAVAAARYLLDLTEASSPNPAALNLGLDLCKSLKKAKRYTSMRQTIKAALLPEATGWAKYQSAYLMTLHWVVAYAQEYQPETDRATLQATALLLLSGDKLPAPTEVSTSLELNTLRGDHAVIKDGIYRMDYHDFVAKMETYAGANPTEHSQPTEVPTHAAYRSFQTLKREMTRNLATEIQLEDFKPKVMSAFVRNRLIDEVYLPLFGDNLAKQLGTAGEQTRTDRMGMLLLISPPGYGKTTLMEYVANRLGLIFVKVNGPTLGHDLTSLSPEDAPSLAAAQELEKLNLAFEMGDNVMLYVDDIQHCHPEFLQKFIPLCDGQRRIEGVYKGKAKSYDLRGRRLAVVMAGNPYTESGNRFQIPDMLANRADIYNLGDIIGDTAAAFRLSYLENSLTSNPALARLAGHSMEDVYTLIEAVENGRADDQLTLAGSYAGQELEEYKAVIGHLLQVRNVVLQVNQAYIQSAATEDAYRTEPAFKLQGSYRNMNKLAEKVSPLMNDTELQQLLISHYQGESQTLTDAAEANFLQLKGMVGALTTEEQGRWNQIVTQFREQQKQGSGSDQRLAQLIAQLGELTDEMEGIREAIVQLGAVKV
ncbi:MAG: DNA repair ATPase [Bacteroidota bacterium]